MQCLRVYVCVFLSHCVLPGDMPERDELSDFEGIHQTINYPLHPLSGDAGTSHGHLHLEDIFPPESHVSCTRFLITAHARGQEKKKKHHLH